MCCCVSPRAPDLRESRRLSRLAVVVVIGQRRSFVLAMGSACSPWEPILFDGDRSLASARQCLIRVSLRSKFLPMVTVRPAISGRDEGGAGCSRLVLRRKSR